MENEFKVSYSYGPPDPMGKVTLMITLPAELCRGTMKGYLKIPIPLDFKTKKLLTPENLEQRNTEKLDKLFVLANDIA